MIYIVGILSDKLKVIDNKELVELTGIRQNPPRFF